MRGYISVYISGKITGLSDYKKKFKDAEEKINSLNYHINRIINPANNDLILNINNTTYEEYIKLSLCELSMCNCIFMLDNWENSKGARLEYEYAKAHDYIILYESDYDEVLVKEKKDGSKM